MKLGDELSIDRLMCGAGSPVCRGEAKEKPAGEFGGFNAELGCSCCGRDSLGDGFFCCCDEGETLHRVVEVKEEKEKGWVVGVEDRDEEDGILKLKLGKVLMGKGTEGRDNSSTNSVSLGLL